jgi:hypothetical protein
LLDKPPLVHPTSKDHPPDAVKPGSIFSLENPHSPDYFAFIYSDLPERRDGWPYDNKPVRWRKLLFTENRLKGKGDDISGLILYLHRHSGCEWSSAWDKGIADAFGKKSL